MSPAQAPCNNARDGPPPRLDPIELARHLREQLLQLGHPRIKVLIGHH